MFKLKDDDLNLEDDFEYIASYSFFKLTFKFTEKI